MKGICKGLSGLLALIICCTAAHASQRVPVIDTPVQISLPGQPKDAEYAVTDSAGDLWLADRGGGRIVGYTPEGKFLKQIGGPGVGSGRMGQPRVMAIRGDVLMVEDRNQSIHVFNISSGKYVTTLHNMFHLSPDFGFMLTKSRILFTGYGYSSPPKGRGTSEVLTLFSTNRQGEGVKPIRVEKLSKAESLGMIVYGRGRQVWWKGHGYAVCHAVPGRVTLLHEKDLEPVKPATLAPCMLSVSLSVLKKTDVGAAFRHLLWNRSHVIGLVPAGRYLGVVWRNPKGQADSRFEVRWLDGSLKEVHRAAIRVPGPVGPEDVVQSVVSDGYGPVYWLFVHKPGSLDASCRLLKSALKMPK